MKEVAEQAFGRVSMSSQLKQMTPFLFVSSKDVAEQCQSIVTHHIQCVINVARELPRVTYPSQYQVESLKYSIDDRPSFPAIHCFDTIADRIAANVAANRRTLLYCHQGRSRSITFVLAYLIKYHRLPLQVAFTLVREKHKTALPNTGFWKQLQIYEARCQRKKRALILSCFCSV